MDMFDRCTDNNTNAESWSDSAWEDQFFLIESLRDPIREGEVVEARCASISGRVSDPQEDFDLFDFFTDSELVELDAASFGMRLAEEMDIEALVTEYMDRIDDLFLKVEQRITKGVL